MSGTDESAPTGPSRMAGATSSPTKRMAQAVTEPSAGAVRYWQAPNRAHGGSAWADAAAATLPDVQPTTSKMTNRALTQWIASAVNVWPIYTRSRLAPPF
jgi:hypothetical protein